MEISSPCAYINKNEGEQLRKFLLELNLLDIEKEIKVIEENIYFPLTNNLIKSDELKIRKKFNLVKFNNIKFKLREKMGQEKFTDFITKHFSEIELKFIPRSIDIIGKIAIIEIPIEIQTKEKLFAELLLKFNKSLESVFSKIGKINGEFRLRELKFLAGKKNTITIHKENGCRYKLDVSKVYFSPRLSTEHARIAELVKPNETVLDMFAGIGPFSILIAKRTGATIYSIDKNPDAIFYLKNNITLNKVDNLVSPFLGDVKELIPRIIKKKFDRIIMNLPESAIDFLQVGCKSINLDGGVIHLYVFKTESESYKELEKKISTEIDSFGRKISMINMRKVKSTAPHEWQVCLDIKIE